MLRIFVYSIFLIGLGAIGGFSIFHYNLHRSIERAERSHNETLAIVEGKFVESEAERARCVSQDNGRLEEMSELRGRLDAQYKNWYDLTAAQRTLVSKHRESAQEAQKLRERSERDQAALKELAGKMGQRDRDFDFLREDAEKKQQQLKDFETQLSKRVGELVDVRRALEINERKGRELESEVAKMKSLMEQNTQLERETIELRKLIQRTNHELVGVKNDSERLDSEKAILQEELANLNEVVGGMQSQIEEKDKELLEYRREEGNLEAKLVNLREGMIGLLKEKIHEAQDLESHIDQLNKEKAALEVKLDNWRDGMLALVRDKMEEIQRLKTELTEFQESTMRIMDEVESARSDQDRFAVLVNEKQGTLDESNPDEDAETIIELKNIIEKMNQELQESKDWVNRAMQEIVSRKAAWAESEQLIADKTNEIEELQSRMETDQSSAREMISKLESDLEEARKQVDEKNAQIEDLNSEVTELVAEFNDLKSGFVGDSDAAKSTSETIIDHIQQRDSVMCRQLFGKGPYYVKFVVRLPVIDESDEEESTIFFVVELSSRKQLPHSTYTFLALVESNLYNDGAAFLFAQDGGLKIGSSLSPDVPSLQQKLRPLGLTGGASLSFPETSTSGNPLRCGNNSFGFDLRGPNLNLFLSEEDNDRSETSDCFARVIRGEDHLPRIRSLVLKRGVPLEIVSAEHLRVD